MHDKRYRLKVLLVTDQRPKYWKFYCCRCGLIICELSGNVLAITDGADMDAILDYQPVPVAVECKRKFCRAVYEFETLSGR